MVASLAASVLCACFVLAGCSATSDNPHVVSLHTPAAGQAASASASAAPEDPAAKRAIARAVRATRLLQSYRFVVTEQLVAANSQQSRLVGAVVRGRGLTYRLTVGHKTTQVVRLRSATYVRVVPHAWSRLHRPRRLANPTQSLIQILNALVPTGLGRAHAITSVHGTLSAASAQHAGLPASRPADVTVTVDGNGRVIALSIATTTQSAGHRVTVRLRSTYSGFGAVRRIQKPA